MDPKFYAPPRSSSMSLSSSSASCSSDPPMPPLSRDSGYRRETSLVPSDSLILQTRQETLHREHSLHAMPIDTSGKENPRLSPKAQSYISTKAATGTTAATAAPVHPVDNELGFSTDAIHTLTQRLLAHRLSINDCDTATRSDCPINMSEMSSMSGSANATNITRFDVPSSDLDRSPLESFLKSLEMLKLSNEGSSSASFSTSGHSFLPWSPETVPPGFSRPSTTAPSKWAAPPQSPFFLPPSYNTSSQGAFPPTTQHHVTSIRDLDSLTQTFLSDTYASSSRKETRQLAELKEPAAPPSTCNSGCPSLISAPETRSTHSQSVDPRINTSSDHYPCCFSQTVVPTSNASRHHQPPPNATHCSNQRPSFPSQVQLQKTDSLACRRLTVTSGPQESSHPGLTGSGNSVSTSSTQPPTTLFRTSSQPNGKPSLSPSPPPASSFPLHHEEGLDTKQRFRQNSQPRISPPQSPPSRRSSSSSLLQFSDKPFSQLHDTTANGPAALATCCSSKPPRSITTHTNDPIGHAEQPKAPSMPETSTATKTAAAFVLLQTTPSWTQRETQPRQAHQQHRSMQQQQIVSITPTMTPSRERQISGYTDPGSYRAQTVESRQQISPRTTEPTLSTDSPWRHPDVHNLAAHTRGRARPRARRGHPRISAADRQQRLSYSNAKKAEVCFGCGKPLSVCDCHNVLETSNP